MSISLRAIRYFNTALLHGSISLAASELNIAASAISVAIDQVEAHFQLKLVNRFPSRGITATASGKDMSRKFARLIEDYDAVLVEGVAMRESLKGELRIGYYAPIAPAFLPSILASLTGHESQITVHLEACDNIRAQEGFLAGDFDVILFVSDGALPQIDFDVLIEAPAYCLMSETHPLIEKTSVSLEDIAEYNLIVLNRPVVADYYHKLFQTNVRKPANVAFSNSNEMVRSLVGAGQGIAVLNMLPLTDVSYAGQTLAARPISDDLPSLSLSIGYDASNTRRIVQKFSDLCNSYFKLQGKLHLLDRFQIDE